MNKLVAAFLLSALALTSCSKTDSPYRHEEFEIGHGKTLTLPVHKDMFFMHEAGADSVTMSAGEAVTLSVFFIDGADPQELAEKEWDKAKAAYELVSDMQVSMHGGPLGFVTWAFTVTEHGMRRTRVYRHVPHGVGRAVIVTGYWPATADGQFLPILSRMATEMDVK